MGSSVLRHHVSKATELSLARDTVVATVVQHPRQPDRLGLRNDDVSSWSVELPDGSTKAVDPGQTVALANGLKIHFGESTGTVSAMA